VSEERPYLQVPVPNADEREAYEEWIKKQKEREEKEDQDNDHIVVIDI
jgi:hypothetical protein